MKARKTPPFYFYFIVLMALMATSCRQVVDFDTVAFNTEPVVNAILVAGDTLKVNITKAMSMHSPKVDYVENAKVFLFVDSIFAEELIYKGDGEYSSTTVIDTATKYNCEIDIPGFETIRCEQILPALPVVPKVIHHINVAGKNEEGISYAAIEITFRNDINLKCFYEVEIRTILQMWGGEFIAEKVSTQPAVDRLILNEGVPIALFSNDLITETEYTLHLNYSNGMSMGNRMVLETIVVEMRKVSEAYYRYKKQLYLYEQGLMADGIITSMTNTNLYSNIENGYGVFAAYSAVLSDTIYPNYNGSNE